MSDILKKGERAVGQRAPDASKPDQEKITEDLQKKFGAGPKKSSS
jgi:hypothetical protein